MKAKSKRQSSNQRHKVERKIREHKRDIRRAAKAMKATGLKPRNKKSRETAKLALRVSNANPDKEKILQQLVENRNKAKAERLARRQENRSKAKAQHDQEDQSDAGSGDEDKESDEELGAAERLAKRSRAELRVAEERLTSKQVQAREKQRARDAAAEVAREKQANQTRQYLFIPAGEHVGNTKLQLSKVIDQLSLPVPAVAVILDARCAVQSVPWAIVDDIVSAAVVERDAAAAAAAAAAPSPASKKSGKAAAAAAPVANPVLRLVLFVLNKADLIPMETLATAFTNLAIAVHERYAAVISPATGAPADVPNATGPVTFSAVAHSAAVETTTSLTVRTLRKFHADFIAPHEEKVHAMCNMKGKLGVLVIGLPGTGKTSFCRALQQHATDSVVSTVPCRTIMTAATTADLEAGKPRKIIIPGAKNITLVTVADDELMKRAPILSGDVVFHSESRIEKMTEPENAAILLAEKFTDQAALCQTFCLPLVPSAPLFLKLLGRCILREKGFQPAGSFAGAGGALSSSALTASSTNGADLFTSGMRRVRVRRRHDDRRNALRIGARCFLKEFHEGKNIVWAVKRNPDDVLGGAETNAEVLAAAVNTFAPLFLQKQVVQTLRPAGDETEEGVQKAIKTNPGAVLLMAIQFSMRDFMVMLPHRCLEVDPAAVAAEALEPQSSSDDDDDEEEEGEESDDDGAEDEDEDDVEEGWEEVTDDEEEEEDE